MSESSDTRELCKFLQDEQGALTFAIVASMRQEAGWPDRYIAPPGAWAEFKSLDGETEPKQRWVLRELTRRGVLAVVVRHTGEEAVDIEAENRRVLVSDVPWKNFLRELEKLANIVRVRA